MIGAVNPASTATSPDGQRFAIFIAGPGSTLDGDLIAGGGVGVGAIVSMVASAFRTLRRAADRKWRIVVQPHPLHGGLGPIVHRETCPTEAAAEDIALRLQYQIETGVFAPLRS